MSIHVKMENNTGKYKNDWKGKKKKILYAWGLKWQEIATKLITANGIVDTGRLRASLTFITPTQVGSPKSSSSSSKARDALTGTAPKDSTIVGSNVVYAKKQELTNKKGAFIGPAILNYKKDYENVTKKIMQEP